jgi:hypothetical protein
MAGIKMTLALSVIVLEAFVDLMDGCKGPHEIQEQTGLPMARCEAIYRLYVQIVEQTSDGQE